MNQTVIGKVIVVSYESITSRIDKALCLSDLSVNGQDIEVWNVEKLLFGNSCYVDSETRYPEKLVNTYDELDGLLSTLNPGTPVFVWVAFGPHFLSFFRILSRYDHKFCLFILGVLPGMSCHSYSLASLALLLLKRPFLLARLVRIEARWFFLRVLVWIGVLRKFDLIFAAGKVAEKIYRPFARQVLHIGLPDFEEFVRLKMQTIKEPKFQFALFLDNNMAYHPDLARLGSGSVEPEKYFAQMKHVFSEFEATYGLKVIIAAHPTSAYAGNEFGQREIITGSTVDLVKTSSLVLAHMSTSLGCAVLYNKPIIFVDFEGLNIVLKGRVRRLLKIFAEELESPVVVASIHGKCELAELATIPPISKRAYEQYKTNYVVDSEKYDGLLFDVLATYIR